VALFGVTGLSRLIETFTNGNFPLPALIRAKKVLLAFMRIGLPSRADIKTLATGLSTVPRWEKEKGGKPTWD